MRRRLRVRSLRNAQSEHGVLQVGFDAARVQFAAERGVAPIARQLHLGVDRPKFCGRERHHHFFDYQRVAVDPQLQLVLGHARLNAAHALMPRMRKPDPALSPDKQGKRSIVSIELSDADRSLGGRSKKPRRSSSCRRSKSSTPDRWKSARGAQAFCVDSHCAQR